VISVNDDSKQRFLALASDVERLFQAILPDPAANRFGMERKAIQVIAQKIRSLSQPPDITTVMGQVKNLLDASVLPAGHGYVIRESGRAGAMDLSRIDFDALRRQFERGRKHIEAEKLRGLLNSQLRRMIRLNLSRMDYYQRFQQMIADYNAGATNIEAFFTELVSFAQALGEEDRRGISEQLTDEELAVFDLLTRPEVKLNRSQRAQVKQVAQELLTTLKAEKLVLDWRKRQQTRAAVQVTIATILDRLPEAYDPELYRQKCGVVYQHVYDAYYGAGKSIYTLPGGS
jgi:type I restriction enzyme R subunit